MILTTFFVLIFFKVKYTHNFSNYMYVSQVNGIAASSCIVTLMFMNCLMYMYCNMTYGLITYIKIMNRNIVQKAFSKKVNHCEKLMGLS